MDRSQLEARTLAFAARAVEASADVRPENCGWRVARQLVDCATSVGANYRASGRSRSRAEFIAKLGLVVKECDEAVYWLELVLRLALGDRRANLDLLAEAKELRAIFASSYRTARRNRPVRR